MLTRISSTNQCQHYKCAKYDLWYSCLFCEGRPGCLFCLFFFFFVGALVSAETLPWDNPETLDMTTGSFRPEASISFFLASSCASSSFLSFRSCSNFQNSFCTSYFWSFRSNTQLLTLCLYFQHPLPPRLSGYASDTAYLFQPPPPLSPWWRQWQWPVELVHPGQQGKGIDQAPGRGLVPRGDPSWAWTKTSPSWACLSSSCWGSCTCNSHKTSLWL